MTKAAFWAGVILEKIGAPLLTARFVKKQRCPCHNHSLFFYNGVPPISLSVIFNSVLNTKKYFARKQDI